VVAFEGEFSEVLECIKSNIRSFRHLTIPTTSLFLLFPILTILATSLMCMLKLMKTFLIKSLLANYAVLLLFLFVLTVRIFELTLFKFLSHQLKVFLRILLKLIEPCRYSFTPKLVNNTIHIIYHLLKCYKLHFPLLRRWRGNMLNMTPQLLSLLTICQAL